MALEARRRWANKATRGHRKALSGLEKLAIRRARQRVALPHAFAPGIPVMADRLPTDEVHGPANRLVVLLGFKDEGLAVVAWLPAGIEDGASAR